MSKDGRVVTEVAGWGSDAGGRSCWEGIKACSEGRGFRYFNLGMRTGGGGGRAVSKSTPGAMANASIGVGFDWALGCRLVRPIGSKWMSG